MAESKGRIYVVSEYHGEQRVSEKLVRAGTAASAIRHVVLGRYAAEPAKPDDIVKLMTGGATVQEAGSE